MPTKSDCHRAPATRVAKSEETKMSEDAVEAWTRDPDVLATLPTAAELEVRAKKRRVPRSEARPSKSRKPSAMERRAAYVHGRRVANPKTGVKAGVTLASMPQTMGPSAARSAEELLSVPVGGEVPWSSDVPRVQDVDYRGLRFDLDVPTDRCECTSACGPSCRNYTHAYLCTRDTCGAPPTKCGRRFRDARDLKLRRTPTGIGVFVERMMRENIVVDPYVGVMTTRDPRDTKYYTAKLKNVTRDKKPVFLSADTVGGTMRFVRHSCDPNIRFEELDDKTGPKLVLTARRKIEKGEEITVDYGRSLWFACECGASNCRGRGNPAKRAISRVEDEDEGEDNDEDEVEDAGDDEDESEDA